MMVARDELPVHLTKLCSNQEAWGRQWVNCPARCGSRFMRKDLLEHISYRCNYRLSECPLNCGNYLKFDKIKLHIYFCPMRPVCCQPEMKSCERIFHRWFYPLDDIGPEFSFMDNSSLDAPSEVHTNVKSKSKLINQGSSYSSTSIVTIEGKVYMKDDIRMRPCQRHGSTVLMYAVKAREFVLAEYIIKAVQGKDINYENSFGHNGNFTF